MRDFLFDPSPDSIPMFWQWLSLVLGVIGSLVGLGLSTLAIYLVFAAQPKTEIMFGRDTELDGTAKLTLSVRNVPPTGIAQRLRLRRTPSGPAMVAVTVKKTQGDFVDADFWPSYEVLPNGIYQPESVIVQAPKVQYMALRRGQRGVVSKHDLEDGRYSLEVLVSESGLSMKEVRQFEISRDGLSWTLSSSRSARTKTSDLGLQPSS
jgi:hypothetical protein